MKNKRNSKALIITGILAIIAVLLIINRSNGTLRGKDMNFAVSDTSNITRIFLADKNNNTCNLHREANGSWTLNGKYPVMKETKDGMMKTLLNITVKSPVAKAAHNTVIKLLSGKSVKVEVYQRVYRINLFDKIRLFPHEQCTRTYYVGDPTMDNRGTFMLMEGSEEPYIVYIPSFRGFVSARYSALEKDWRDRNIFSLILPDISSVEVQYAENPAWSFRLQNRSNRNFELSTVTGVEVADFDTLKVIEYLGSFRNISLESFLNDDKALKDSVTSLRPAILITVADVRGGKHSVKLWQKKAPSDATDLYDKPLENDPDRMFALVNDDKDFVLVQSYTFDRILKKLDWFTSKEAH
jgi:hypothetical protein